MKVKLLMVVLLTVGCSNQAYYNEQQFANRNECYQMPLSQRQECLARANITFGEYERDRKELIDRETVDHPE